MKEFNKEFYEKTYLKSFPNYESAYSDWVNHNSFAESRGWEPLLGSPIKDDSGFEYTSQLGQDHYYINEIQKRKKGGFFIEFGACDGLFLSNTYVLEKYFDWDGICIEPFPEYFESLKTNRKCIVDNSLIYKESNKEVSFSIQENPETNGITEYKKNHFYNPKEVILKTKTLEEVLDFHNCPKNIDYLSIDTEGTELEILKSFPFEKYHIGYICIEHGNDFKYQKEINEFLISVGYSLKRNCWWDDEYEKLF